MAKKPKKQQQQTQVDEDLIEVTTLKGFQRLSNGIERGELMGIFGPAFAGKTTLAFDLGCQSAMKLEGDLLVFDTESSRRTYKALRTKMERKYNVPVNIILMKPRISDNRQKSNRQFKVAWEIYRGEPDAETLNVYILLCPDIQDILIAHGRGMDLMPSDNAESGKMKATPQRQAWARTIHDAPFMKFCMEANIKCLIYDSMTNPVTELTAVSENFPARGDLNAAWFTQLHKVAAELDIPIICTLHESRNPTGFSKGLNIKGGATVLYQMKTVYYLMRDHVKGLLTASATRPDAMADDERALYIFRHPEKRPWQDVEYFTLTDNGLIDRE